MNKINREQIFLGIGIACWIIYLINLFVLGAISPGYSHMRHQVSHLGTTDFPYHSIFNAVKRITGRKVLAVVIGISVGICSINCFFAGFYPMPDPRHGGYGIGTILFLTPLLLAWAFWKIQGTRFFIFYQFITFALIIIGVLIMGGVGGLVSGTNAGLFQRLNVLVGILWFTYTCYWLIRHKSEKITSAS